MDGFVCCYCDQKKAPKVITTENKKPLKENTKKKKTPTRSSMSFY